MNTIRTIGFMTASALVAGVALADLPEVTDMKVEQRGRTLKVDYKLTSAPAVVTMDVQTNSPSGWASIGGENIQNFTPASAVFRIVDTKDADDSGVYKIRWRPDLSWPGHKLDPNDIRVVLTAWATNATPDYMVVDLTLTAATNSQAYYPSVDYLPGGLFGNDDYRTSKLVMRRIHAKDVEWTMGSINEAGRTDAREKPHLVKLASDYYIGVFPVTQSQWQLVTGYNPSTFTDEATKAMRPVNGLCWFEVRCCGNGNVDMPENYWPNKPRSNSFLGRLRTKTGLDFDMPGEAQWEFACRAGNGEGKWGNGAAYTDATTDPNLPGRYAGNAGTETGTKTVGSYGQNDWGIYDMHGNVKEWCLDWWYEDISGLGGAINIDPANPSQTLKGTTSGSRMCRGGCYGSAASACRSADRAYGSQGYRNAEIGVRVVCGGGLQ